MTPFIETTLIVVFILAAFLYLSYVAVSYVKKLRRIQEGGGCGGSCGKRCNADTTTNNLIQISSLREPQ